MKHHQTLAIASVLLFCLTGCNSTETTNSTDQYLVITPTSCHEKNGGVIDFQYRLIHLYDDGSVRINTDRGQNEVRLYPDQWKDLPRMEYTTDRSMKVITVDKPNQTVEAIYRSHIDTGGSRSLFSY